MKGWKGSAFVSSVILVMLLVVALSTATFAWFSANNVVNVSSISFIAQTRDKGAAPGDLQIAWEPNPSQNSYIIEFAQPGDSDIYLAPLMPLDALTIGATLSRNTQGEEVFAESFTQGVQDNDRYIGNGLVYSSINRDIAPYLCVGKEPHQNDFYLINRNVQWGQEITVEYSMAGDLADKLCIAIFVDDVLSFILSDSDKIYYGSITKDTLVSNTDYIDWAARSKDHTAYVPANSFVKVTMYAWYNGVKMTDNDVYKESILNELQFKGNLITR